MAVKARNRTAYKLVSVAVMTQNMGGQTRTARTDNGRLHDCVSLYKFVYYELRGTKVGISLTIRNSGVLRCYSGRWG